jgi:hypothetical protein
MRLSDDRHLHGRNGNRYAVHLTMSQLAFDTLGDVSLIDDFESAHNLFAIIKSCLPATFD